MSSSLPDFEQRLSNLQEQMDRLRPAPGREFGPAEQQLVLLTDQCAEIVRRWALTSERHARAVSRFETHLSEWNDAGVRLQQDASQRVQELEKVVQHEWEELRDLHAEPVRQLHEHATNLTQVCIATANAAQQNFERSEARLAAIELEFDRRMTELTREIQTVVAELRSLHQSAASSLPAASAVQAWPLEGVTRLHNQLRHSEAGAPPTGLEPLPSMVQRPVAGALPEASAFSERLETLERSLGERNTNMRAAAQQTARVTRTWRAAVAMLALVVVTSALVTWRLWEAARDADERAVIAQKAATAATDAAARDVAATREATARDMKSLVDRAAHAQTMVDVLAAPDLIRYNLAGRDFLTGASAHVHWSRSSGVVFRGLRMPAPPAATTYQLWLLTRTGAVGVATFAPDASGAATVAIPPPQVTRAVVGAVVTLEPAAGSQAPSGSAVLARPPEPDPSQSIQ